MVRECRGVIAEGWDTSIEIDHAKAYYHLKPPEQQIQSHEDRRRHRPSSEILRAQSACPQEEGCNQAEQENQRLIAFLERMAATCLEFTHSARTHADAPDCGRETRRWLIPWVEALEDLLDRHDNTNEVGLSEQMETGKEAVD